MGTCRMMGGIQRLIGSILMYLNVLVGTDLWSNYVIKITYVILRGLVVVWECEALPAISGIL